MKRIAIAVGLLSSAFLVLPLAQCSGTNPADDGGADGSPMKDGGSGTDTSTNDTGGNNDAGNDTGMDSSNDVVNDAIEGGGGDGGGDGGCNNNDCANATTLTSGMLVTCDDTGFMNLYDFGSGTSQACNGIFGGTMYTAPNAVFKIDVPSNMTLAVTVTPIANMFGTGNITVGLLQGPANNCAMAGANCLDSDDPMGGPAVATWMNNTNATVTIYIIIGGNTASDHGQYSVLATVM